MEEDAQSSICLWRLNDKFRRHFLLKALELPGFHQEVSMKAKVSPRKLTSMAMFAALSVVLAVMIHFPIFPAAPFLEYDPADIPILIAAFLFGPLEGLVITAIACLIQGLTVSASSGVYGILMHFIATGSYVLMAGILYRLLKKNRKAAIAAVAAGSLTMAIVMCGANLVITPLFMKTPVEAVQAMLLPVILPFNLIKAVGNGIFTLLVFKQISKIFQSLQIQTQ